MNYYRLYTEPADETTLPLGVGVPTEDFPMGPEISILIFHTGIVLMEKFPVARIWNWFLPGRRVPWMDVSMNWCVI